MNLKLTKNREILNVEDDFRITNIGRTIKTIIAEYNSTIIKNDPFNSTYEGWALIKEKVDGLWEEIRKDEAGYSKEVVMKVAAQIGAMAMRFMVDLGTEEEPVRMNQRVGKRKSNYSHFF